MFMQRITGAAAGILLIALPLAAQVTEESVTRNIERAEAQIRTAEQAGAAAVAADLMREARERLDAARLNATSSNRAVREDAQRRAIEALEAALAAEAVASSTSQVREANRLRADVQRLGGAAPAAALPEVTLTVEPRASASAERVAAARAQLESALRAGAREAEPALFEETLKLLDTAENLTRRNRQSDTADHLAYLVEMRARRMEATLRAREVERVLPDLQLESARLGREASERAAAEDRRRREEAERIARQSAAEAERARLEAERAREQAQREAAEAQARAQAVQAELDARRQAEQEQQRRLADLEARLAEIADTRQDEGGLVITLPGIYFDTGRSELKQGARETLTNIVAGLQESGATFTVRVIGHTDSVGAADYNQRLSLQRARAVRDFLASAGLDSGTMMVEGRGEDAPVASNDTVAGRQQNRRVELVIRQQR